MDSDVTEAAPAPLSYSYRDRPESFLAVAANRVSVTAGLFATAIGLSYLLGRKR
jgi:hypothetical protein